MKTVIALSCALCLANLAEAQVGIYNGAESAARRAVSKTEAAENQNPDAQPPPSAAPAAPQPMNPVLAATLQNIASLRADLASLTTNGPVSSAFTNDLMAASTGTKGSPETITKLATDLQAALAGNQAFRSSFQKLAQFLHAVSNGSHLTPEQFQTVSDTVEQILTNGGAPYQATSDVLDDLKHLARETK